MSKIKEQMIYLKIEKAANCAQMLVNIVGLESRGKKNPELFQAVGALGYGHGTQGSCGALTGGVCALALHTNDKEQVRALSISLSEWFKDEYGGTACRDILGEGNPPKTICYDIIDATIKKCFDLLNIPFAE